MDDVVYVPPPVKGYRTLKQIEIDQMNHIKALADIIGSNIEEMAKDPNIDQRWLSIAKTDLQKGFMSLVRSIAQPTNF
jgi:hypothetical protein